ncbi:hypothetical protein CEXT_147501 [Caerostris extrusa]|uniref:Uncharacterized protein n=1 Tax=Caerostris extrusa TaxID=172846 RepID=A0AAV4SY17_CAEEX|nr:hypothetical protein CEXT_147501 [Caerostris extrusa]
MAVILRGVIRFYYFLRAKYGYGRNAKNSTSSRGCDLQMNIEICSQCKQLKSLRGGKRERIFTGGVFTCILPLLRLEPTMDEWEES